MRWIKKIERKLNKVLSKTCYGYTYCSTCLSWHKCINKSGGYCKEGRIPTSVVDTKIDELLEEIN